MEQWIRGHWTVGSIVEVRSAETEQWFKGKVVSMQTDEATTLLEVQFVERMQTMILRTFRHADNVRPWSKALSIYRYIHAST